MVFRSALHDGMVLYDDIARSRWIRSGRRVSLEVDPVTEGTWHAPTPEDAQEATEWARAIYETVLRDLAERGFTPEERS